MLIHKETSSQWSPPAGEQLPPAPFIVGAGRCGTTLLRLMLDAHPDLAIPPETHFIPHAAAMCAESPYPATTFIETVSGSRAWGDLHLDSEALGEAVCRLEPFTMGEALRLLYRLYAARFGKARWGDKTPIYFSQMSLIHRLLPEARFIHIIRDGRDVALSYSGLWFGPRPEEDPATWWVSRISAARREALRVPCYLEIRYEDLVTEPEATLRKVCRFICLPWCASMLGYSRHADQRLAELDRDVPSPDGRRLVRGKERVAIFALTKRPPDPGRIGRWRSEMSPRELTIFERGAGSLLRDLGYGLGRISNGAEDTL